jgi:hypothetical protein
MSIMPTPRERRSCTSPRSRRRFAKRRYRENAQMFERSQTPLRQTGRGQVAIEENWSGRGQT